MNRFGHVDPFYAKMDANLARERIERICTAREPLVRAHREAERTARIVLVDDNGIRHDEGEG